MLSTLFVVDQSTDVLPLANNVVTFETYLQEYPKLGESKLRVINLCDCDRYLSQGYYCSLLAEAGEKLGMKVHPLEASELYSLGQYDGLFIRETTAIDHHTYRLAQEAEQKDLVVIDDPSSILRCCNKVFLHDAFNYKKVPSLETRFVSQCTEQVIDKLIDDLSLPMVLKMPESSFSKGVFKVKTKEELTERLEALMKVSAIVLAQAYLYTEYDWRIGVLNGRAVYACRYHMARNHWQIYNHSSKRNFSGGFDTLPTFEVPKAVLRAALKAAAVVGNGLYGIDIKEHNGKAYVLEVNDNPNIDQGVEDKYLGDELYMQVMSELLRRLEARGKK
ncbi:RimK-like ATPgrasp N-terminal domain-containing protein [Pseudoalteromonas peptidolytica]|uniref:RimK-like ATPgrasp N-terminal domain-containing protein n=1 Tax=Pseudoalteromonas peptidolytica TaxID=61150 RepID=UPI00298DBA69|nr:RimK-like ATPgrasp N-terminal domain-containing protein [Pseudoalteromonas peptidolytica]MDW7547706.1 RimK-like ATPgrasp N-terminal domain-containing protein [Pseudoalteromonas peptidolytica]